MKYAVLIAAVVVLNSCNTSIGMWRDTKQAYSWTQQKVQGKGGGGGDGGASAY
jgi:predicted small secreted protein